MLIALIISFAYYTTYKLCKTAAFSDNQELEDKLFVASNGTADVD